MFEEYARARPDRVLVTGGAGFIGSHVCEALLQAEIQPVAFDNLSSGKLENLPRGAEFVLGDVRNPEDLRSACNGIDAVVHLAAEPSVRRSVEQPSQTHLVNYLGTLNVLEAMREGGTRRIVYASSAAVYPESDHPQKESVCPSPSSPYGLDKLSGEHALRIYEELHEIRGTALRFFNVFGERQDPASAYSGVISIFASRLSGGLPLKIFGDGSQTRDFVYVRDVASVIARLIHDPFAPRLMNVGTGVGTSLLDLVTCLEEVLSCRAEISFGERRPGDIRRSLADTALLESWMGSALPTSLSTGLSRLLSRVGFAGTEMKVYVK